MTDGILHRHIPRLSPYTSAYGHQEQAFRSIRAGRTTLVATGTGSGKTECFLFPIVSRCLELRDEMAAEGILSVIVYPMNALAEDQLQRMREMLAGTGVTFGMYVGKTPDREENLTGVRLPAGSSQADYLAKLHEVRRKKLDIAVHPPEERVSRDEMRTAGKQPRILLTNVKQLELLLTRQRDLELFDNARLEFLVFDEAHTFTGAQGAETACLIRRLRAYCGKDEKSTICVATSATIADPVNGLEAGRAFASRFFGVDEALVELVGEFYEADVWGEPRTANAPFSGDQSVQLQTLLDVLGRVDRDDAAEGDIEALRIWFQSVTGSKLADGNWREALYKWLSHNEVVFQIAEKLRRPRRLAGQAHDGVPQLGEAFRQILHACGGLAGSSPGFRQEPVGIWPTADTVLKSPASRCDVRVLSIWLSADCKTGWRRFRRDPDPPGPPRLPPCEAPAISGIASCIPDGRLDACRAIPPNADQYPITAAMGETSEITSTSSRDNRANARHIATSAMESHVP